MTTLVEKLGTLMEERYPRKEIGIQEWWRIINGVIDGYFTNAAFACNRLFYRDKRLNQEKAHEMINKLKEDMKTEDNGFDLIQDWQTRNTYVRRDIFHCVKVLYCCLYMSQKSGTYDKAIYRGVSYKSDETISNLRIGDKFVIPNFASFTSHKQLAEAFATTKYSARPNDTHVVYVIPKPKGIPMVDQSLGIDSIREPQCVLLPYSEFQVTEFLQLENVLYICLKWQGISAQPYANINLDDFLGKRLLYDFATISNATTELFK